MEKWGPGCLFYGHGSSADLEDLEDRCIKGERFLALFCEFPGNPLLKTPDLRRIRKLADLYDFAVVIDETIGNFINVHVLPCADVVVSSLTKVFSGDSNVMGGRYDCISALPGDCSSPLAQYSTRKVDIMTSLKGHCKPNMKTTTGQKMQFSWNGTAETSFIESIGSTPMQKPSAMYSETHHMVGDESFRGSLTFSDIPVVKQIYYPKYSPSREFYDHFRYPTGGYGGLLSVTFNSTVEAVTFFDVIDIAKGPSLGTNFTLWLVSSQSPFQYLLTR